MIGSVAPCVFPGCTDIEGNPRLVDSTICEPCRHKYRRTLNWLAMDFVHLKSTLPAPSMGSDSGARYESPKSKSFGHPAEWASMTCTEIAQALNWAEDGLRDHLEHTPGIHQYARESILVAHGYKYLLAQFDVLCVYPAAEDTAAELDELQRRIRSHLGLNKMRQWLPTPCPWCDTALLVRSVGQIDCEGCGKIIEEQFYGWFVGDILDKAIEKLEREEEARLAKG